MPRDNTILILDCATTGFQERKDHILEIACILVAADTFDVIDTASCVIRHTVAEVAGAPDFHAALVAESLASEHSQAATEGFLIAGPWSAAGALCNRALDFDLRFLQVHMPALAKALPKLHIELKALEFLHVARGAKPFKSEWPRDYRAGNDAIAALEELMHWSAAGAARGGQ